MNVELANKLVERWNGPNGRPLFGKLIDMDKQPDAPDCMCAQGWALFDSGMPLDEIAKIDQSKADLEVAKRLGISRTHAVLLRNINDSRPDSPSVVLTDPAAVIGEQSDTILAFWTHIDTMDSAAWAAARSAASASIWAAARSAAWSAAGDASGFADRASAWDAARYAAWDSAGSAAGIAAGAARATNEIQGAEVMRQRGQAFFFLPIFGFDSPEAILKKEAK